MATNSQAGIEVKQLLVALDDPTLSAEGFARSIIRQVSAITFPQERIVAAQAELVAFERVVRTLRTNDDAIGLRRAASELYLTMRVLSQPIYIPSPAEVVRSMFDTFQELGWGSGAIELLMVDLKPDDLPLKNIDKAGVTTSARRIDLEELIVRHRPHGMIEKFFESWRKSNMRPDFMARSDSNE